MRRLRFVYRLTAAVVEDLRALIFGPRCQVTREHVYPRDRAAHERDHHYGEGACA